VADGGEREQPFNVPLAEPEQRLDDGGDDAQHQEQVRDPSAVPEHVAEHRPVDPRDPVEAGLDRHPRGNSTQTGVGATACASASRKWNGTIAARHPQRRPQTRRPVMRGDLNGGPDRGQRCTRARADEVQGCYR
jgi:hypothetical protein